MRANLDRFGKIGLATGSALFGGATLTLAGTAMSPIMALVALLAVGAAIVLVLSPQLAFLATAVVIPIERLGRLTPDSAMYTISLMRIVGSVALVSVLLQRVVQRRRIEFGAAFWLYSAYFAVAVLGVFHSSDQLGTVRAGGAILGNLLFFLLVVNLGGSFPLARAAVGVWLVSTVVVAVFTIYAWHFGAGVSEHDLGETSSRFATVMEDTSEWEALDTVARAAGPTSHSAVYAINLLLTLPFFFYFMQHTTRSGVRALLAAGVLLVLYNVFLTNTRAAILLAAGTLVLCAMRGMFRVRAGGLVAGALAVFALLPLVPNAIWDRVLDPSNYSIERSATLRIRFEYWGAGLQVAQENWFSGIGVGNQKVIPAYISGDAPEETTVHNEFLQTFMEVGLPGWLMFFGFVALVMMAAVRGERVMRSVSNGAEVAEFLVAIQIAMLVTLIYGLQVDVFHFPLKGWWLLAGLSWALYREALVQQGRRDQALSGLRPAPRSPLRAEAVP